MMKLLVLSSIKQKMLAVSRDPVLRKEQCQICTGGGGGGGGGGLWAKGLLLGF